MSKKHKAKKEAKTVIESRPPVIIEKYWDYLVILFLLIVAFIYFAPFLNANRMIGGSDYLLGSYPFEEWTLKQKELPLWYSDVFGGIPVLGSPVGGPLAPLAQLRSIIPPHVVLAITFIILFFLAGLGTYLYLKNINLSPFAAAIGAVIYQFAGNLATSPNAGHAGRAASIAIFPLMLFFLHKGLSTRKIFYFILMAMTTAFTFYEGHFQMTYYALLIMLGYAVYYLIAFRREIKKADYFRIIGYGLSSVVMICIFMAAIWLPVTSGLGTVARGVERGYQYAISWSMPPTEIIDLVFPSYSGVLDNYWGFNSFKIHMEYFGIFAVFFGLVAVIMFWEKRYVKFFTIAGFLALLVALGGHTPIFRIFYTIIPGFKLTRAPSLIFFIFTFSFVVLASSGFDSLILKSGGEKAANYRKRFILTGIIVSVIFLLVALIYTLGRDGIITSMQNTFGARLATQWGQRAAEMKMSLMAKNYNNFTNSIWRSLLLTVIFTGIGYAVFKKKIQVWTLAIVIIALTMIDQLAYMTRFLPSVDGPKTYYAADEIVNYLKKDKTVFRVLPSQWYPHSRDLYLLCHGIQSAGGYVPNPIQRYQEYIGAGTSVMFTPANLLPYHGEISRSPSISYKLLDMLNIKYLIVPNLPDEAIVEDPGTRKIVSDLKQYVARLRSVFQGRNFSVFMNEQTLPRAYVIYDHEVAEDQAALDLLMSDVFDQYQSVVLEEEPNIQRSDSTLPYTPANIISYSANQVVCQVQTAAEGILVLGDNWHPDWKVFVDGKQEKLYRANYTFRAVIVPAGEHEVVFKYISNAFNTGRVLSTIAWVLAFAFIAYWIVKSTKLLPKH